MTVSTIQSVAPRLFSADAVSDLSAAIVIAALIVGSIVSGLMSISRSTNVSNAALPATVCLPAELTNRTS